MDILPPFSFFSLSSGNRREGGIHLKDGQCIVYLSSGLVVVEVHEGAPDLHLLLLLGRGVGFGFAL